MNPFAKSLSQNVKEKPDAVALVVHDRALTFSEFSKLTQDFASNLGAMWEDQSPGHLPLLVDKSMDSYIAVASCLLHGIPFALVDGFAPKARIQRIFDLLGNPRKSWAGPDVVALETSQTSSPAVPGHSLDARPTFVITTSGSTGQPKGVEISFESQFERASLDLDVAESSSTSTTSFAPLHFIGGLSRLTRVFLGPTLHVLDPMALTPNQLLRYLEKHRITHLHLPPQLARLLAHYPNPDKIRLSSVKMLRMGSEGIRFETLQGLRQYLDDDVIVRHSLGATEAIRSFVNLFRLGDCAPSGLVPIGKPTERALLRPVPGLGPDAYEVLTCGPIAEGYLKQPELTAERFLTINGVRYWKSGDHVREISPQVFLHIGRSDDIVKVRGMLASPSETTATVMAIEGVRNAITLPIEEHSNIRLVCHVELADGCSLTPAEIRSIACSQLPPHLAPHVVFVHNELPVNARGKIDRLALQTHASNATSAPGLGTS